MKKLTTPCVSQDVDQLGLSHLAGDGVKWPKHFRKGLTISNVSEHRIVLDQAVPLLGINPREMKMSPHTSGYTDVGGSDVYSHQSRGDSSHSW